MSSSLVVGVGPRKHLQGLFKPPSQVVARRDRIRQRQAPTRRVLDPARVVQCIGIGQARGRAWRVRIGSDSARTLRIAPDPVLLKPADVTEFPQRRIDFGGIGDLQGGRAQRALVAGKRAQRVGAAFEQRRAQLLAVAASDQRRIVDDRHAL